MLYVRGIAGNFLSTLLQIFIFYVALIRTHIKDAAAEKALDFVI